ncbi:MAG: hypothetical protein ACRD3Y_02675, partial [Bryobacteraceae bacterium]
DPTLSTTPSMHALDSVWEDIRRECDAACSRSAQAARSQITHQLNQTFRRLHAYEGEAAWIAAILDGVGQFSGQTAVFSLKDGVLRLRLQQNLDLPADFSLPASAAAAFAGAIESKDPVIALRTAAEVSEALSSAEEGARAHIIPVLNGSRVAAIVFAASRDYTDVNALELIAGMASAVLERQANTSLHAQIAPSKPAAAKANGAAAPVRQMLPAWADLSAQHRTMHIQAQRFSRVKVAEMQLARPEVSRAAREQGNLYLLLKNEIDTARQAYATQFMTIPSMVDYLHLELVRSAAEGDESKLGADYPGQLA